MAGSSLSKATAGTAPANFSVRLTLRALTPDSLGKGDGQTDITFIGISIGVDASCGVEYESDGDNCPEDDGNDPLHVTSG